MASTKLEELRARAAIAATEKQTAEESLEIATLEAIIATSDKLGARGRGRLWEVVPSSCGPFVVVRGDMMHFRAYQAAISAEGVTPLDHIAAQREFAVCQVSNMTREEAEAKFNEIPGVIVRISDVLVAMHRGEDASASGKR